MAESCVFSHYSTSTSLSICQSLSYSNSTMLHKPNTIMHNPKRYTSSAKSFRIRAVLGLASLDSSLSIDQTVGRHEVCSKQKPRGHKRVFFLDVNPLCYKGSTPCLNTFAHWLSLFFSQVSITDPVIAVIDGERGNEYRRQLLPSYKANRRKFVRPLSSVLRFGKSSITKHQLISDVLRKCNVPVVRIDSHEADDVVATLVGQVLDRGYRVVIASPDKDFKQLISEDVQIVMPMPDLDRWSFYTLKHYVAQYNCDPCSDLSLRCIMGDEVDGVPGIQQMVPGFGRKTAIKLLKKHGSLENLLSVAAVRTIGKPYAQEALINYADYLRKNYEVLALRRDVSVHLQEEWLLERNMNNDAESLSNLIKLVHHATHEDAWCGRDVKLVFDPGGCDDRLQGCVQGSHILEDKDILRGMVCNGPNKYYPNWTGLVIHLGRLTDLDSQPSPFLIIIFDYKYQRLENRGAWKKNTSFIITFLLLCLPFLACFIFF